MSIEVNTLHQGLNYEQYAAEPGIRASDLKLIKRSPAHMVAAKAIPQEYSEPLEFGKILHMAVENGERFLEMYKVPPEFIGKTKDGRDSTRSKEALEKKAAWFADLPKDAIVVQREWVEPLKGMLGALTKHRLVGNLLKNGVKETSLWVQDPDTGETLKCRPDFISQDGFIVDLKTTRDAHPSFFKNQIFSDRSEDAPFYILQAAHYAHCARVSRVANPDSFIIVAVEKEPPYGVMVYPLDIGCLGPGEQWRAELTQRYADCKKNNVWPSYPEQAVPVVPPQWVSLPGVDQ